MKTISQKAPLIFYFLFSFVIIAVYLYYRPSWGVVDDWQHIETVNGIWNSPNVLKSFLECIKSDFLGGKLRLLNWAYAALAYKFFYGAPWMIYIFNFIMQFALLPLWGIIYLGMFEKDRPFDRGAVFIYPLSFFIFTPFWNNFMYISLQEKLIFIFSSIAIYFFIRGYNKSKYMFYAFIFALFCLFSKPTGVFIILTFLCFSVLRWMLNRKSLAMPVIISAVSLMVLVSFFILIKSLVKPGGYSSKYIENLSFAGVLIQLRHTSIIVKFLLGFAIVSLFSYFVMVKKRYFDSSCLILPIAAISYIAVVLPWGISNYFLGPLVPFVIGMVFPVYSAAKKQFGRFRLKLIPDIIIIVLSLLALSQIIVPRIIKIAEIKAIKSEINRLKADKLPANFYFPPDYPETSFALGKFTNTEITYLSNAVLDSTMLRSGNNYLIYRDECSSIKLINTKIVRTIFQNNTWKVFLIEETNNVELLNVVFPRTILQKMIRFINR